MDKLDELNKQWEDLIINVPLSIAAKTKIANLHTEIIQEILNKISIQITSMHTEMHKVIKGE